MGHVPLRRTEDVNYQLDHMRERVEMLERRFIDSDLPAAWLILDAADMSAAGARPMSHMEAGYEFRTNDPEVFFWNEPDHDASGFFGAFEGVGSNPYITSIRDGTYNCSWAFGMEFADDIMGASPIAGELILRIGIDNFDTFRFKDFYWPNGYRDILIDDGQYIGHGPDAGEPPWTYGLQDEIDHKFTTCSGGASYEQPLYWYPTARAIPGFTGPFASSAEPLGGSGGVFVVQWMSDLTKECFPG